MATAPEDYPHGNPIFAGRALTLASTSCETPAPPKQRPVPPIVGEIIGKLGLRYRPTTGTADLEAHAEALKLLCEDCADIPPHLLDAAAREWVREQRFMPRASELRALARETRSAEIRGSDFAGQQLQDHCDKLNESEARLESSRRWRVVGEAPKRQVAAHQLGHAGA